MDGIEPQPMEGASNDDAVVQGWEGLPVELQQEVWLWLPYLEIFAIRKVCTAWYAALSDCKFWKEFNRRHFGGPKVRPKDGPKTKWRVHMQEQVKMYLTIRKNVATDANTLFSWIVKTGHHQLLHKSLNERSKSEREVLYSIDPPLTYLAASHGHLSVLMCLANWGFNVEAKWKVDNATPIFGAAKNGHYACVAYLLDKGVDIEAPRSSGSTPLFIASQGGYAEIVALLIKRGAKVIAPTNRGATPLSVSSQNGHLEVIRLLVANGAPVSAPSTADGATPLSVSADRGHFEVTKFLIDQGANINSLNVNGATPFYFACKAGHTKIVQMMIENGANINLTTKKLSTPLLAAAQNGRADVVRILLANQALPNTINVEGITALFYAVIHQHHKCVKILLRNGATVSTRKQNGELPLMVAVKKEDRRMTKILLARGDDATQVNTAAVNGDTPLYIACSIGTKKKTASEQGEGDPPVPPVKDMNNKDAGDLEGMAGIVGLLLQYGADYNLPNMTTGKLPLEVATEKGHTDIVEVIEKFIATEFKK